MAFLTEAFTSLIRQTVLPPAATPVAAVPAGPTRVAGPTLSLQFTRADDDPEVWAVTAYPIVWGEAGGYVDATRRTRPAGYLDDPVYHAFSDGESIDELQIQKRWWDIPEHVRCATLTALGRGVAGQWVDATAAA